MMPTPSPQIDLYDHEVNTIQQVWDTLRDRHQKSYRNYDLVEREIIGRFADAGFVAEVNWYGYAIGGQPQPDAAMPEISIVGRCDPKHEFDHDQQVSEVTKNILDLPGQEGVIKTDEGEAFRKFREGGGDHGHGHSH
jgi:hypothetical protein